jgi:TolB-like protein/Tfp pilus assembly protein PilF
MQALFAEMKRRRVFRVMAVYGAVAFGVLQIADLAFPRLGMPEWTVTLVLMLALLGFPVAIVLAWAFEATSEGVKRTEPARPEEIEEIVAAPRSHRWPAGLLALASMILLFGTGWYMGGGGRGGAEAPNLLVGEARASEFETLAALPFRNVNGSEENGIIAVGLHEDLLSQLTMIGSLRVTSRTSVQEYADTDESLGEIAKQLGVAYLLEGSVQSSGSRIRVTVRLVDAAADRTLWTQQFNEEVTPDNLLDIQTEISRTVVEELQAQLTPEENAALAAMQAPGSSVAQQWYYRGLAAGAGGFADAVAARDAFAQAVQLDPTYTAAWSELARLESWLVFIGQQSDDSPARAAMERTEELAPNSVAAHLARGYYEYYARQNFDAALSAFQVAERLAPSDADAIGAVGLILRRQGKWEASTERFKRSVMLDPRNLDRLRSLKENLASQGAYRDADAVIERSLAVDPTNSLARAAKVRTLVEMDGDTRRASGLAAELRLDPRDLTEAAALVQIAMLERDWSRVTEISKSVEMQGITNADLATRFWRILAMSEQGDPGLVPTVDSTKPLVTPQTIREQGAPAIRGWLDALAGRREAALAELEEATRRVLQWQDAVFDPGVASVIVGGYGALGELDAGFAVMEEAIDRPSESFTLTALRKDVLFDAYRDDPRFAEIVERRERFEAEGRKMGEAGRPWVP